MPISPLSPVSKIFKSLVCERPSSTFKLWNEFTMKWHYLSMFKGIKKCTTLKTITLQCRKVWRNYFCTKLQKTIIRDIRMHTLVSVHCFNIIFIFTCWYILKNRTIFYRNQIKLVKITSNMCSFLIDISAIDTNFLFI